MERTIATVTSRIGATCFSVTTPTTTDDESDPAHPSFVATAPALSFNVGQEISSLLTLYESDRDAGRKEDEDAPLRVELDRLLREEPEHFVEVKELIPTQISDLQELDDESDAEEIRLLKDLDYKMEEAQERSQPQQSAGKKSKRKINSRRKNY